MKYPPRGMRLPDTSHLAPEDAELFVALYIERNCVSRGELQRVRVDAERAARSRQQAVNEPVENVAAASTQWKSA